MADILIAFPVNSREIEKISALVITVQLGLLVDAEEGEVMLGHTLDVVAEVWIKIDLALRRAGIWWEDCEVVSRLANLISSFLQLNLRGLLTYAGQTNHAQSKNEIMGLYQKSNSRM